MDNNIIKIRMPIKKEYSQILRLTIAGVGNQALFDLDTIEDMKVVVSEILNCLIPTDSEQFDISFSIEHKRVKIEFETCDKKDILRGANEMTIPILKALVSSVEVNAKERLTILIEK